MKISKHRLVTIIKEEIHRVLNEASDPNIKGKLLDDFTWTYPQSPWKEDAAKVLKSLHEYVTDNYDVSFGSVPTRDLEINYSQGKNTVTVQAKNRDTETWRGKDLGGSDSYGVVAYPNGRERNGRFVDKELLDDIFERSGIERK